MFLLFRGLADSQETEGRAKRKLWGKMVGSEVCIGAQDRQKDPQLPQTLLRSGLSLPYVAQKLTMLVR